MTKAVSDKLTIHWRMSAPPIAPKRWKKFVSVGKSAKKSDAKIEKILDWPSASIAALRYAFGEGLSRSDGWASKEAFAKKAAEVFKRGVACSPNEKVNLKKLEGSYDIIFCKAKKPSEFLVDKKPFFIIDQNVADAWPEISKLKNSLILSIDEISKDLGSMAKIFSKGKKFKKWVAIGGGVLCDTAGFAASEADAKITFVPTTLLSMADACVGGKTGVNFEPYGKNQVGAFYFPNEVLVWDGWLKTLSEREWLAGGSECLKHVFLSGNKQIGTRLVPILRQRKSIQALLPEIIEIKARVVEEDPAENGKRAILNFGHTLGHALEAVSHKRSKRDYLLHGDAIAYGMLFAAELSKAEGGLSEEEYRYIESALKTSGCLPNSKFLCKKLGLKNLKGAKIWREVLDYLSGDKKVADDEIRWVLLKGIGEPLKIKGKFTHAVKLKSVKKIWTNFTSIVDTDPQPYKASQ